jgi:hypothetical protein
VWSRDGKELFLYDTSTKALMRVAVEAPVGGAWKAVAPEKLLDLSAYGVEELDRTGHDRRSSHA